MRILFVTGSLAHGGAERHTITLINGLAARGHECHAVYVKNDPSQLERIRPEAARTVHCLEAGAYLDRRAVADFAERMRSLDPDIVVAANDYALLYATLARRAAGNTAPLLVTFHTTTLPNLREVFKLALERPCFWLADTCIYVCERQRRHWLLRGVCARHNEVIHNGVDTAHFAPLDDADEIRHLRAAYGFATDDFVIGISAVLRPEKNHTQLLDALAELRQRGVPARLLIIGDGPLRGAIEARISSLGVERSTRITGFRQDVRPDIAACNVIVLCSNSVETFSLAALEAMAMGRPVVHAELGGAAEMIEPGENGYLFPVGDTAALVDCLQRLADPVRSAGMGQAARRIVAERFSEKAMLDRYELSLQRHAAAGAPLPPAPASPPSRSSSKELETMSRYQDILEQMRSAPKTWLLTGAAGFIGSHLLEMLLRHNQQVVALDNFCTGSRRNLAEVLHGAGMRGAPQFRLIEGDIRDPAVCREACRGVDIVLHQAALGSVPRSIEDPVDTHTTNVDGFMNMLDAARTAGVGRFVYASSSSVYGDAGIIPMREDEIGRPLSPYALSKRVDEMYADVFARCYGMQTIGLRYFNVFGPRQDPDGPYASVIPRWIGALIAGEPLHINGDGSTSRDFCYVDNVVQANLLAATTSDPAALNQAYNVALSEQMTLDELFLSLRQMLSESVPGVISRMPEYRDFRAGDMHLSRADIGRIVDRLGYTPAWTVRDGLRVTVDWYVEDAKARRGARGSRSTAIVMP